MSTGLLGSSLLHKAIIPTVLYKYSIQSLLIQNTANFFRPINTEKSWWYIWILQTTSYPTTFIIRSASLQLLSALTTLPPPPPPNINNLTPCQGPVWDLSTLVYWMITIPLLRPTVRPVSNTLSLPPNVYGRPVNQQAIRQQRGWQPSGYFTNELNMMLLC